jgi:membrane protein
MRFRILWKTIKQSFSDFFEDRILKLSAALAYYTLFSLPGLLIIIIWFGDFFYGQEIETTIYAQIHDLIGPNAALQIQETIRNAALSGEGRVATIIGVITLFIGATTVFGEIQDSINVIWRLKPKPKKGWGWLKMIVNRLLSFSMIISLGFILLVSLVINSLLDIFIDSITRRFPETEVVVVYIFNMIVNFLITSLLFGLIFKVLPDAKIQWKHVRAGAFTTALLFMSGRFLISFYLGQNNISSAYGAAGSIIIVLIWVYYSAIILYFGAVFTRAYAVQSGSNIYPNNYAVWVQEVEVQSQESLQKHPDKKTVIEGPQQEKRE